MKAMILAAGMGERLRPLTSVYPKVLVPVVNKPVIDRIIQFLTAHKVEEIIVNAHHHYQMIRDYLKGGNPFDIKVEIRIEKEILGTGGGIKNTHDFWGNDPFIVINGDILTDIDLGDVYAFHLRRNNLVTMVLHDFPPYNKIRVDSEMNILSIGPGTDLKGTLAFTGIHVINPEVLSFIPDKKRYNIIDAYKRLIDLKKPIRGYIATGHRWIDIGTIADYLKANFYHLPSGKSAIAEQCRVDSSAILKDWAVIGQRSSIEQNALVQRSVLWNDVIIKEGIRVVDSVVTSGVSVVKDLVGGVAIR
ncbi:MAG: nucleotidyltransferase family protein [Deltaproteobacteria bacterium]|nr:nucleotidyltransferase family protein [Deltaproteobacteria bacterium]